MLPEHLQRWVTGQARKSLAVRLELPLDPYMQDWEWEVADPSRLDEFLNTYLLEALDDDERFALMEVIIQSIEDTESGEIELLPQWKFVEGLLKAAPVLHAKTVNYWSTLADRPLEDCFRVTGPMRRIWAEIQPALYPPSPESPPIPDVT